ncbi:uncharacterized protein CANTADRAFT_27074 [Suhomyces tanzawaensis NRRL Y-17324]|uniref:Uncharacterized protein n=1 Tax=Suhomyces tanzawaensis NRRL Y-17324 TaxID=984487 RepID=A0A1E4SF74_9ASCO|nr:uncharacterized protein CANTADRAFT_27074 [Suhomyces tanzawaensis NRRL Y-17324]ODV78167.1 hypothetical protein CANTADRAFT_27074 [Suhomyces tanzawaensis NRRL Y-17324]
MCRVRDIVAATRDISTSILRHHPPTPSSATVIVTSRTATRGVSVHRPPHLFPRLPGSSRLKSPPKMDPIVSHPPPYTHRLYTNRLPTLVGPSLGCV